MQNKISMISINLPYNVNFLKHWHCTILSLYIQCFDVFFNLSLSLSEKWIRSDVGGRWEEWEEERK